jgi:hypothetical protein
MSRILFEFSEKRSGEMPQDVPGLPSEHSLVRDHRSDTHLLQFIRLRLWQLQARKLFRRRQEPGRNRCRLRRNSLRTVRRRQIVQSGLRLPERRLQFRHLHVFRQQLR